MLYRAYVDEAGDRGVSPSSSRYFVVSAVIVPDQDDAKARAELAALKQTVGREPQHTLHFRKLTHSQKVKVCQEISTSAVARIINVIICKADTHSYISQPDPMYLWSLRLLLERISWYVDNCPDTNQAKVTFAHVKHFKAAKLHSYRTHLEATPDVQIRWSVFDGHPFRIEGAPKVEMLQVADIAASALFRAIEPDDFGNTEPRYLKDLAPKIYRRGPQVTSYGLKVFPTQQAESGGTLAWLQSL